MVWRQHHLYRMVGWVPSPADADPISTGRLSAQTLLVVLAFIAMAAGLGLAADLLSGAAVHAASALLP